MTDYTDHSDSGMTYCHKCQEVYRFGATHTCPTPSQTSELEIDDNDFNPSNFGMWTDMNLSSQADFLEDIIHKHGNPVGEYSSLSEILDALRLGQRYAMRFRRYTELHSASSELKLEIRERVTKNLDILRKRAECDMLPAPIACSLIVEIQMCLEQLWGVGNANL